MREVQYDGQSWTHRSRSLRRLGGTKVSLLERDKEGTLQACSSLPAHAANSLLPEPPKPKKKKSKKSTRKKR